MMFKKTLLMKLFFIFLLLIFSSFYVSAEYISYQYTIGASDGGAVFVSSSFTANGTGNVTYVLFEMKKYAAVAGNVYLYLYDVNVSNKCPGNYLIRSNNYMTDADFTGSYVYFNYTFNTTQLTSGTRYVIASYGTSSPSGINNRFGTLTSETICQVGSGGGAWGTPTADKSFNFKVYYRDEPSPISEKIIFVSQIPSNLTAITGFTSNLNVTYNFSLVNLTNPLLNYSIVGSPVCAQFNNQTCDFLYNSSRFVSPSSNVTSGNNSLYSFVLGENNIYPINKNLNDSFFNVSHSSFNLNTNNYLFSTEFLNISNSSQFNILEVMALSSASSARVYACNSSYDFSSSLLTNANCQEIGSINSASYNHTHGSFSGHNIVPFTIFNSKIGGNGISVTSQMFFVVRGANTGVSNVSYVSTSSRTNLVRTSINSGVVWSAQTYTADTHIHQYPSTPIYFSYSALGNYSGVQNNTAVLSDLIDIPNFNPQPPILTNPFGNNQSSRYINISWLNATNITFSPIVRYNLTLLNSDLSFNRTINSSVGLNNSFVYDLFIQNLSVGIYFVRVYAYDGLNASSYDEEFFNLTAETEVILASQDSETGMSVSNFSFSILRRSDNFSFNASTSNGTYVFNTLRNTFHNISIDASGYALFYANFSSGNSSNSTQNFTLYKTNSITISILNEANLASLSGTPVNVSFVGLSTFNYNTSTGVLFVSNLTADYYEIKFEATGFSPKSYFVTITNRSTQSLTALLTATFSGIGVYLKNAGDEPIIAGLITIQRFINSSYITIGQGQTDGIGYSLFQLENGINYLWTVSAPNFVPKQFLLKPYNANQPYVFKMVANITSSSLSFNEFVSYYFLPSNQTLNNGSVDFSFTSMVRNSSFGSNSILWTALNCNGTWVNVSSPSGTTIIQSMDLSNRVGQTIVCLYGLKVDGYSSFYFQNNYFVSGYVLGNNTLIIASEDFKNDTPEVWQGIFAMFLIAISVLIAYEFSKEARDQNLIVSVAGFGMLTFLAFLGWVNLYMTAIIVIEGVLLYFSNRGGN